MLKTTLGQLLINNALPPELRDYSRVLDKKGLPKLFQILAEKYPDKYREVAKRLSDIGHQAATESGGFSLGIKDLQITEGASKIKQKLQQQIKAILTDKRMTDEAKKETIIKTLQSATKGFEDKLYDEAVTAKNPLALQILSGARGNPGNLRSVLGGDLLYEDHRGRALPIPVLKSYAQGLSPVEYWASTFGARKGVVDLKFATQDAGFFGKQLNQSAHRLVIADRDGPYDPKTVRGVPMPVDDPDNEGSLLARDVGPYKRNTILTPKILADLEDKGFDRILVRSPIVGGHPDGGIYAADVGVRERGALPPRGDNVGMAAAQALSEPVTQAQISSKHTGGVAGAGGAISGFKYINQLVQVPKTFTGGATHAQTDGKVAAIMPAPAGGKYLMIGGQRHYVPTGFEPNVRRGDIVEAGDVLSDGLPNPAEIVRHKGIGEGRRYFIDVLRKVYKDSGMKAHRRNIELLSRGLINHVRLTDSFGDGLPDDVVPYDSLESNYKPRDGYSTVAPNSAVGRYLEQPVLHYSIGTKIRPSMLREFSKFGVKELTVHPEPPPFEPVMIRAMENLLHDPDWMTRQLGTNLRKGLLSGAHRGATSNELGSSFVPSLSKAVDFGRVGLTKGWQPTELAQSKSVLQRGVL